jgi:benzylsuccinate CoA-transferase BbsE subunit
VLDLTDHKAQLCGKQLADMGADVILVEPTGGSSARRLGPFYHDIPHPERSLFFWTYNTSKRSVTLNLESPLGREAFKRLVRDADVVVESFQPGYMASLGIGYEQLTAIKPDIIYTAVTDFGQTGPWTGLQMSESLHLALGGPMASTGYDPVGEREWDTPPIAGRGHQAWHLGGMWASMSTLAAVYYRRMTGEGQFIDVSIHDACGVSTETAITGYDSSGKTVVRQTGRTAGPELRPVTQFPTRDGKYLNALFYNIGPGNWGGLVEWLASEGMAEDLTDDRWYVPEYIQEHMDHVIDVLTRFIAAHDADYLFHGGQERGFAWVKINAPEDLTEDRHLAERGFWQEIAHPEMGEVFTYPGPPYIFSESPWRISRRPPLIGEHNPEILTGELGYTAEQLVVLTESGQV